MIDTHHPPAPDGPGLPPPPQPWPWQPAEAARAAAGMKAVFAGPGGQLVEQRWDHAAGMAGRLSGWHAVFVLTSVLERLRGPIKGRLLSTGGFVVRDPRVDHAG